MSIEQQLKELILRRYGSIHEFSIQADMPYSTIDSIFRRGVGKAGSSNVFRICNVLGISTDSLAVGKIAFVNPLPVNQEETDLLGLFRQLGPEGKQKVKQYVIDMCALIQIKRDK